MPLKQTHFYRDYAIAHRVFATEETEEIYEHFCVNKAGNPQQLFWKPTLEEARMAIDDMLAASTEVGPIKDTPWKRPRLAAVGRR